MSQKTGKVLRILAILFMGGTAVLTLLGGLGTACIAWNADNYGQQFAPYVPYKPVYQLFVYIKIVAGAVGIVVTYALVSGDRWAYKGALATLVVGLGVAAAQLYYTSVIKEVSFFATAPTNMRFFITLITLVLFLVLKLPGIRDRVDFIAPWHGSSGAVAGGITAFTAGAITLTTPVWAGPTHMLNGYNLVNVLKTPLMVGGGLLMALGVILLAVAVFGITGAQTASLFRRRVVSVLHSTLHLIGLG